MSDNAQEFRSATFQQSVASRGAAQLHPRRPTPDQRLCGAGPADHPGRVLEAGVGRYLIPKQTGLRLDLERYLRYYNTERAHTGRWTKGRTPQEVLGKAKLWHKKR
jgi:hypothetical protein